MDIHFSMQCIIFFHILPYIFAAACCFSAQSFSWTNYTYIMSGSFSLFIVWKPQLAKTLKLKNHVRTKNKATASHAKKRQQKGIYPMGLIEAPIVQVKFIRCAHFSYWTEPRRDTGTK